MPKSFERCHQTLKLMSLYILQSNSSVSVFIRLSFVNRTHYQLKCGFWKLKEMPVKCVKYTLNPFNICSDILRPNINQNSSQKRLKTPPCHAAQTLASTFLNYILVKVSHLFSADSTADAFSLSWVTGQEKSEFLWRLKIPQSFCCRHRYGVGLEIRIKNQSSALSVWMVIQDMWISAFTAKVNVSVHERKSILHNIFSFCFFARSFFNFISHTSPSFFKITTTLLCFHSFRHSLVPLKWGSMRYLSIVSLFPTANDRHTEELLLKTHINLVCTIFKNMFTTNSPFNKQLKLLYCSCQSL